jgi:hypothetical protein
MRLKPTKYVLKYIIDLKWISYTSVLQSGEASFESRLREVCPYLMYDPISNKITS